MKKLKIKNIETIKIKGGEGSIPVIEIERVHKDGVLNNVYVEIKIINNKIIISYKKNNNKKEYELVSGSLNIREHFVGHQIIVLETSEKTGHIKYLAEIK
tara:strand:- start:532 stop:831 length:300 start_codon:yes stop_codon:yes gene_type:complete